MSSHAATDSAYLAEAQRRADEQDVMRVHVGKYKVDLRVGPAAIASINTRAIGQVQAAERIAKRYNTHPALLAAAQRALEYLEQEGAGPTIDALREALQAAR